MRGSQVQLTAATPRFPAGDARRLVIVDDDLAVCNSLKFSFELEGFVVHTYASATDFLNDAGFAGCDCFVIDQRMPGLSGMELIAKLRDLRVRTPAILLISHPNPTVAARAAAAEIPIVEKPLLGDTLADKVCEACRRS
jgi:FixJ family two-component response regulator